MNPDHVFFWLAFFGLVGLAVCAVTGWMERSPESKAYWDRVTERVFK